MKRHYNATAIPSALTREAILIRPAFLGQRFLFRAFFFQVWLMCVCVLVLFCTVSFSCRVKPFFSLISFPFLVSGAGAKFGRPKTGARYSVPRPVRLPACPWAYINRAKQNITLSPLSNLMMTTMAGENNNSTKTSYIKEHAVRSGGRSRGSANKNIQSLLSQACAAEEAAPHNGTHRLQRTRSASKSNLFANAMAIREWNRTTGPPLYTGPGPVHSGAARQTDLSSRSNRKLAIAGKMSPHEPTTTARL